LLRAQENLNGDAKHKPEGFADKFNEIINGVRYGINSARIESAHAGVNRIQSKFCGLLDTDDLFMEKCLSASFSRLF